MMGDDIKFSFEYDSLDKNELDNIFKEIGDALNIQFDEDLNYYKADHDDVYSFKDVSGENSRIIQTEMNNFFDYSFNDIVNKPLYKFLVLQNNDKIIILANISSQIFDYASVNKIYGLFDISTKFENNIPEYHDSIKNYLNSSDFKKDSIYWKNHLSDIGNHVKFYNVKSDNYRNIKIHFDRQLLREFLKSEHACEFNFFTAIFSLYLSRIDRTGGTLLKTLTQSPNRNTLLKIDYNSNHSFVEYLKEINDIYLDAVNHTKVDIENYSKDIHSYYSIFDFSNINDNIFIKNGEGSALTLNIHGDYLDLVYNVDLFSAVYIEHMASNIESLISNIFNSPNQIVGEVNILCDDEISLLCEFCRGEIVDRVKDNVFANDFRNQAINNPDVIAIDDGVNQVTYGELERLSNSVAYDLSKNYGISRGNPIGIMLPRNYHFPNVVLALNKLGAFYIPLDPIYPAQRIDYMINFSQSRAVITTREFADSFDFDVDVIYVEDLKMDYDVDVDIVARGDDLLSIMFTSGTTGSPKGVMITNEQVMNRIISYNNVFKLNPGDTVGIFLSFSFIGSYSLYCCLSLGGTCRIFNESEQKDSLLLLNELKEKPMSNIILPPGIGVPIFENEDLKLKYMVVAGANVGALKNKESFTEIVNFYGATETIISIATILDLNKIDEDHVPLGRPVANTWIYVLDENGMQLPIGVPGEICISSDCMSRGYYNDPELTNESFVDNPYSDCDDNKILYRTGDIGFYNSEGFIEFVGREDDQLSVRGFRVESMEIIKVMKSFKEISQVVLDVDYDNLIVYYTTNDDLDVEVIKEALKNALPYYMVPSLFIELESIPLNSNGKIDKFAINEIFRKGAEINIEDDVLGCVVDLFKEVLHTDSVLIDDDFVALGGNSLSAMKLQMLLKNKLNVFISSNEIIELSTPANIANKIRFNLDISSPINVNYTFEDKCPLGESQLNVYLDEMVNEMGSAYNNPFKIYLKNSYPVDEIINAINKLLDIYPILSARVITEEESIFFSFDAKPEIKRGSDDDIDSFVQRFELDKSLSRFLIVDDDCLLVDFHHLIFDGSSLNILINTLLSILNGNDISFIDDGILKQISFEESIKKDYMDDALEFYDSMLAEVDETYELLPSPDNETNEESVYFDSFNVDDESLRLFLRENSITHNQLFSSVFAYTLSRFTGSSKVFFNLIEDGRGHIDLSDSVGMFVRTLPLVIDCSNQEIDSFLTKTASLVNSTMKYDLYPFRILASKYDLNSSILFQYSHNLFSDAINKEKFGFCVDELKHDSVGDMSFSVYNDGEEKLGIKILYSDKFSKEFIKRFADSYISILNEIMDVKELSDINYASESDLILLDSYNQTEHPLLYDDILDAFNANLSKNPNNALVSYNDVSYSYGESAYMADKIARKLTDLGVKSQDCIGFLVPRSELYMISILSILSIGAIYVPLDDNLPDERIKFIVNDSQTKVIIVSDDTCERAANLGIECTILNISDIINDKISTLSRLPVTYGNLACILYTSGTTGVPKGVKITRKAMLNTTSVYCDKYEFNQDCVGGMFSTIGFDIGSLSIMTALYSGASLNIIPEDIKSNMFELHRHINKYNITHISITSQVSKLFMQYDNDTSLRILSVGGEKLGEFENPNNYMLIDEFGPTESFAFVSSINNANKIDPSSIGPINRNMKFYVLDDEFRRVPIGAVGELYLSGFQIAEGYLNREEENTKSFLVNPFDENKDYDVLYRTGDMVRILPDGSLGIVGRRDSQVKIRGNRVELTEIESAIRMMDLVDDVTVQAVKNADNYELVAYIVPSQDIKDESLREAVCDYVGEFKPDYMIPSYVIRLDSIPLTVNGKVDKRKLPSFDLDNLHADYIAPTNELENIIVRAFEDAFNRKGIGLFDDFTRMGGDSITAIRLISSLQKNNINVAAKDILTYKTPYLIAQNAEEASDVSYESTVGEVGMLPIQNYYFNQVNDNTFTQQFLLKSSEDLDLDLLQNAFDELSNVHDMLRATYKMNEKNIIQEISPINMQVCKIKEYLITSDFNESVRNIFINSRLSIDVEKNNLVDVSLIRYGRECYVLFVIHHLIIDGVSWNILLDDLTYIYNKLASGENINLNIPYPYKYWVSDVKKLVENITDEEKQYWIDINDCLDDFDIKGKSNAFSFKVDADFIFDNMLMLSEEEFLGLAIARAYKKTYKKDIIFNRESHGRDEDISDVSRTVGWFTSQYPVSVKVGNGEDHISLMRDVYNIKEAFKNVNHLGLNYESLIYTTEELEFKHCPVTFNFLSNEFVFKNSLFESYNFYAGEMASNSNELDSETFGISFNVSHVDDSYRFDGNFALGTYISEKFDNFVENIKNEMEFIAKHQFNNDIVCYLSELQLGVYLDEKVHDKKTAYSISGSFPIDDEYSIDDIRNAIMLLIDKHPILKGRIIDDSKLPLLVCDSNPAVEIIEGDIDVNDLIKPFDLNKTLSRFYIIDNEESRSIFYDMHHIISDATSNMLIKNELKNILSGDANRDVDLGFVYASYYSWEAQFKPEHESARKFFCSMLSEVDDVQNILGDVDGSIGCVSLPVRGIRSRVESFVRENGITVGSFLNAVFAYTYSRFTGSDKVYYTFTEHGRHEAYAQDAVGMFVRTIPVIIDCANTSVEEYLSGVSDTILDCMKHGSYPFRLLASMFDLNHDVSFEYNYDLNDVSGIGDEIVHLDIADEVSEFLCVVNDLEDGYLVSLNHLDILSQDTAERFVKVFKEVLIQFLDKSYLKDINYISNEDLELLDSINQTEHSLVYDDVLDAFNDNLKKYPENRLVSMNGISYSYSQGAYICDKIAKKLGDLGIKPDDCVGFLTERSEYYMFSILGILSVGGVYVPLDDKHPDDRIKFMLDDTSSRVVIVSDETYDRVNNLIGEDVVLLNISEIIKEDKGSLNYLPVVYGNLASILYTSGSTGIPKGVKITRKSVLNLSSYYCDTYGLTSNDVYGLYASIGFDAGSQAILQSVYAGSCLSVIPEDIKFNIDELNEYFIKENIAHVFIPTQVAKLFMDNVEHTSLKKLSVGGEKLGSFKSPEKYSLFDAYGPTETFAFVSSINNIDKMHESCVGFLNYNTKAYVLDGDFRRAPFGAIGELCLSGYQVADGYLNREEENSNTFIDNPFDDDYDVLYRTGDMVRLLPDGSLGIVGRRDSQVKIRGNRVELSEVESVIRNMEITDDVTVQSIRNENNNELVAYVVPSRDIEDENLKDIVCGYVGEHKPEYMIPSYVVKLDEIPMNVNGKVDKHALPDFDKNGPRAEYVAPRNENEKEIVEAFEKVLNLENVSIYDDFVRLGGDSLTAIRLLSYIKSNDVTMADIFTFRTPEAIAGSMSDLSFDLDIYTLESGCPLNSAQINIFGDAIGFNKLEVYMVPGLIPIPKSYSPENILNSLDELLNVHPILRMRLSEMYEANDSFDTGNLDLLKDLLKMSKKFGMKKMMGMMRMHGLGDIGGLYNIVKTVIRLFKGEYPYMIKGDKPPISWESNFDKGTIEDFLSENLDIYGNLSKFMIVEGEESYYLFYMIHHLIFDAVSVGVFKRDFLTLLDGGHVDLDDTFLKTSAFTQQIMASEKFEEASEFFATLLSDVDDVGELLGDNSSQGYVTSSYDLKFDKNALKSFINNMGISEGVLFTSVFAYTLSQFVNGDKVLFMMAENGRDRFNENFIGMADNVIPLVADCKDQSVSSFMEDMANRVYGVLRHNYYPLLHLYQKYNFEANTLFQFVPNWIADDFSDFDEIAEIDLGEIRDYILNNYDDYIAEFFFQIFQNGEDYRLVIINSNKYSDKMVKDFKDTFILILSNIINLDNHFNLSDALK